MKITAITVILLSSALMASGDDKPTETTGKQGEGMPKTWFPNVDGIFTKGEFIDLSAPKGERLYIRYGPISDSGVELERVSEAGKKRGEFGSLPVSML